MKTCIVFKKDFVIHGVHYSSSIVKSMIHWYNASETKHSHGICLKNNNQQTALWKEMNPWMHWICQGNEMFYWHYLLKRTMCVISAPLNSSSISVLKFSILESLFSMAFMKK